MADDFKLVTNRIARGYGRAQSNGAGGFAPMTQMALAVLGARRNGSGGGGPTTPPTTPPTDPNNPGGGTGPQSYQWSFPQYSQSWAFTPPTPTPYMNPAPFDTKKYGDPFAKTKKK